ncbi:hypothetical protein TNCV_1888561 [Trichonephila clavipes]|nr:hypothetical protein TNCV_1888561 [Trichonephila clavipes]
MQRKHAFCLQHQELPLFQNYRCLLLHTCNYALNGGHGESYSPTLYTQTSHAFPCNIRMIILEFANVLEMGCLTVSLYIVAAHTDSATNIMGWGGIELHFLILLVHTTNTWTANTIWPVSH